MHETISSFPFLLSLKSQDILFNYNDLDLPRVIDFHYFVNFLYDLYSVALKFDGVDKNDEISKRLLAEKENINNNLRSLQSGLTNYVNEIDSDSDFHDESKEYYKSMIVNLRDLIRIIKFRFFRKYLPENIETGLVNQEDIIVENIERYLFLPYAEPEIIYTPISSEMLAEMKDYFISRIENMIDLISYFQKLTRINFTHKEKSPSILFHAQKRFEKREYHLIMSRFQQFMKMISKDAIKLQYLESRWGISKWKNGEETKNRKKPNIKNLAYFFKDMKLVLTIVDDFLSENNMDMLRQLTNLFYGQQHGFTLQSSDIEKIKRIRHELS